MDQLGSLEHFAQYLERRAPGRRTAINYVSDVRQFLAVCAKPWREVTMHDIDAFVDSQRAAGLGPATVKRRVAALKVYFDFLTEESGELSQPNPVQTPQVGAGVANTSSRCSRRSAKCRSRSMLRKSGPLRS